MRRFVITLFGSSELAGPLRLARRVWCLLGAGGMELDLRRATLEDDAVTLTVVAAFGGVDVYCSDGAVVDLDVSVLFGSPDVHGTEVPAQGPRVRVAGFVLAGGVDVRRVPAAWADLPLADVRQRFASGEQPALEA